MVQIPIIKGVTVQDGAFAASYPVNLEPRALESGVSAGQLVSTRGAVTKATGPGADRGGIEWNGTLYRVMGSKLCSVTSAGAITELGDVGTDGRLCRFTYSFDRLAVRSAGKLWYWNGTALVQVTDPDLGTVLDVDWMDGYFFTTDGEFIVATELLDPTSINPLKYGSAEEDPDPVKGVRKYAEELLAIGRHTITPFDNTAGLNFPLSPVQGATIPYGAVAADAFTLCAGTFAFVGSGRNEPLGLFIGANGTAARVSDKAVEDLLNAEPDPSRIVLECRSFGQETQLYIHLAAVSIGISLRTSAVAEEAAYFLAHSGQFDPYRVRSAVWCYGEHWVGDTDSSALGVLSDTTEKHFGDEAHWRCDAALMFKDGQGFGADEIEVFGQFPLAEGVVFLSITRDGAVWSPEVAVRLTGRRDQRVIWHPGVHFYTLGAFRFRGNGRVALSRAEMRGG